MDDFRKEYDSLGEVRVPSGALYGAQTRRAMDNFRISGIKFPRVFIRSISLIKAAAAEVNSELGLIESGLASAIKAAADETAAGLWDDQFPVDVFQTGSGTSTNMNANEVIANRAMQVLGGVTKVHPNDHVNRCQSSNDVVPSAVSIGAYLEVRDKLMPALKTLSLSLDKRSGELKDVIKTGRTHLMDAVPLTMGQEIGGWAFQVSQCIERISSCLPRLAMLAIGGTAVGTGMNAHPEFGKRTAARLSAMTGLPLVESPDHFAAQSSMDAASELSGHLKVSASCLLKIANDLRWMSSGPIAGLNEISLPALQPGSSIMGGKMNPVACEAVMMACVQIIANDTAVAIANSFGNFQLNTMMPLIAHNLLESLALLGNSAEMLSEKVVEGFTVNSRRLASLLELNPILATALGPIVGHEMTAEIVEKARAEGRSFREVAAEISGLPEAELDKIFSPKNLTGSGS
ncbi:MAG: class II fumarate hydratase [Nitrospirae bacterium]|nr:MAG: class II fumarate hydratase [Nitrospirota bacterium]